MDVMSSDDDIPFDIHPNPPARSPADVASRDLENYHMAVLSAEGSLSVEDKEQGVSIIHEIRAGSFAPA